VCTLQLLQAQGVGIMKSSRLVSTEATIGHVAQLTGCPIETIRYYERIGLLPPAARSAGNYRVYRAPHIQRLHFIRRCRLLNMPLDTIRLLLKALDAPEGDCNAVDQVLDRHIDHVLERVAELQALEKTLRELRGLCRAPRSAKDCRILLSLAGERDPRD